MPDSVSNFPANKAAERSALGAFVESPSILSSAISEGLTADDFSVSDYQRVFRALSELRDNLVPIDCITLAEHLGNSQYDCALVADLMSGAVVHHSHVLHHVRIIRQKSRLRSLLRLSDWIAQAAVEPCADPDEIVRLASEKLDPVSVTA